MSTNLKIKKRYLSPHLDYLLSKKIVLLSGPRQVGKTTLAKALTADSAYYNYDIKRDYTVFKKQEFDRTKELVIFDELHKMRKWKLWLKGLYDDGLLKKQKILVTGSSRLDIAKKMGDSLAGRFFSVRLNPLDLKELAQLNIATPEANYQNLLKYSGFIEPFFEANQRFYGLWSKSHLDLIIRQDLLSTENVRDLDGIETLVELLTLRVGSTVSFNSLREDLDRDDKTIKRWIQLLENLFIIFRVTPYSKNIARSTKKAAKFYFYDLARIQGDEGLKLENMVALALKKELEFNQDILGINSNLYFAQTKEKKEIDFIVEQKKTVTHLIEVKLADQTISKNFSSFGKYFKQAQQIQLVRYLDRPFENAAHVKVVSAIDYLAKLDLLKGVSV